MSESPGPTTSTALATTAIQLLPKLLWFILAVVIFATSYRPLLRRLDEGELSKVSFATFQIEFVRSEYNKAKEISRDSASITTPVGFEFYADRVSRSSQQLNGLRALWVDDLNPTQNFAERRALSSLGISFDLAKSNDEAQALFDKADESQSPYHLVISDMGRSSETDPVTELCFPHFAQSGAQAGCKLLQIVLGRYQAAAPPVIFYSSYGDSYGTPPGAFGATADFDSLFGLVLDASERRGPDPESPPEIEKDE